LMILGTIILIFILLFVLYNIIFEGLFFGKSTFDILTTCGNPTPEGLYETKCYSQEKINSCSDIGWILHIETGKAKGCLEDEMCCKRLLPDALS